MRKVNENEAKKVMGGYFVDCPYCSWSDENANMCKAVRSFAWHMRAWHDPGYPIPNCT